MHEAAWRGYSRCVKLLCTLQQTPRSSSKKFGKKAKSVKHVEDEWKNHNYLNTPNAGGFSPLHLAAQNGHNQSCREILLAGANPDVKNNVSGNYIAFNDANHWKTAIKIIISICVAFSTAIHRCIRHVGTGMQAQQESSYQQNVIRCV